MFYGPGGSGGAGLSNRWPVPARTPVEIEATDSAPIVVIGVTRGPVAAHETTRQTMADLVSAVLLTVEAEQLIGHRHDPRVDAEVAAYLIDLTIPEGLVCR